MQGKTIWAITILKCLDRISQEALPNTPVNKGTISKEIGISTDYIEQIMVPLKNAGIIDSIRGLKGGFILTTNDLSVMQVRNIMEPPRRLNKWNEEVQALLKHYYEQTDHIDAEIKVVG